MCQVKFLVAMLHGILNRQNMAQLKHEEQLQKIFSNVNDWLKFAEAKNFGLLTLNAAIIFGISQIDFGSHVLLKSIIYYVFVSLAVISSLSSLISLFPIVSQILKGRHVKSWINKISNFIDEETPFENIHFYGYLRNIDENEFESQLLVKTGITDNSQPFTQYEKELVTQIIYNSRIAWLKYQLFKIGAFILLSSIALTIMLYPITAFILWTTKLLFL